MSLAQQPRPPYTGKDEVRQEEGTAEEKCGGRGLEGLAWQGHQEERAGRCSGGSRQGTALKGGKQGVLGYIGYVSTMQGHL